MIDTILTIICYIFDCTILLTYLNSILGKRNKSIPLYLFILGLITSYSILYFGYEAITLPAGSSKVLITMAISVLTVLIVTFFFKASIKNRIFVTISFQVFCIFSEIPAGLLMITSSRILSENNNEPSEILMLLFSKIILFTFVIITKLMWDRKKGKSSLQYNLLVLTTPIITIIITLFIPSPLSENKLEVLSCAVTICGMFILNIANYFLLGNILKVKELEEKEKLLDNQLTFQADKYSQISTAYRSTRSILHDIKKHFFYLDECLASKQYDKIQSYLKTTMENLERSYSRINTGNLVIDAFVSNYMAMAKQENIVFIPNINVTKEDIEIKDYDLCVVLGNLLDNSIQACRKVIPPRPRKIEVNICTTHKEFVIHIKNTMEPATISNKDIKNPLYHGYGIENVKNIVLKYYGNYSCFKEDIIYQTVVTIPIMNLNKY